MRKTLGIYLRRLLTALVIFTVLSGGNSRAEERSIYRVIITVPNSNITTQMRVWAENEEEARENVALNGWQILSIEQLDRYGKPVSRGAEQTDSAADSPSSDSKQAEQKTAAEHTVTITKVGSGDISPFGRQTVKDGDSMVFKLKPEPCQSLEKLVINGELADVSDSYTLENISKDTYVVAVFRKNGTQCDENKIDDKDLKEIAVIYFDLGRFKTKIPPEVASVLKKLNKKKDYVIIGHTDDVRVMPNVEYKDNYELSAKRASFLKKNADIKGSVKLMGMGPAYPVAPNRKEGQRLNRRAVIYERR